jgi:hypothetical protein
MQIGSVILDGERQQLRDIDSHPDPSSLVLRQLVACLFGIKAVGMEYSGGSLPPIC